MQTENALNDSSSTKKNTAYIPFRVKVRPYLIIAPALLLTIGILYPFFMAWYYSFTNYSFSSPRHHFIGLDNWIRMFTDKDFWHAFLVTCKYAIFSTGSEMIIGIGIALLLAKSTKFTKILKVTLVFPLMVAPVIATVIWQLMTNNSVGIIEKFLNFFNIYNFPWASSANTAMFTAVLIDIWVYTPFVILLVLAGIQSLPKSPFEAALVDGASPWFTFKNLKLPLLKPFIYIALIFRLMASLQESAIIFALTKGGPGNTLMNLSITAYTKGFQFMKFGASLTYILFLWFVIALISNFLVGRWLAVQKQAVGH